MMNFFTYGSKCVIECEYTSMYIIIDKKNNTVEYGNYNFLDVSERGKYSRYDNLKDIKIKLSKLDDIKYSSNFISLSENILFFHRAGNNKVYYFRCEDLRPCDVFDKNVNIARIWESDLDTVSIFCKSKGVKEGYVEFKKKVLW